MQFFLEVHKLIESQLLQEFAPFRPNSGHIYILNLLDRASTNKVSTTSAPGKNPEDNALGKAALWQL